MITQHILVRKGREPLNSHYYATTYPDVYAAGERLFGSWKETIEAAGLDYNSIRKYKSWTRHTVLKAIRDAYAKGEPINSKVMQDHNKPLYMAAIRRFGNWENAVKAGGISYGSVRVRRLMTKAEIKHEIITLYRQKVNLSYTNMRKNYQYLLAAGMKKLGDGSWVRARRECGILTNYRLSSEKRQEKSRRINIAC